MTEVLIKALSSRIKAGQMDIEQVPEMYRNDVRNEIAANATDKK